VPQALVEEVLEAFNDRRMTERQACAVLGLKRTQGRTWPVSAPASNWVTVCWWPAEGLVILWNDQPRGAYAL